MIRCIKIDSISDWPDIEYVGVNTKVGIHFLIGPEFADKLESVEIGNVWILVNVSDDYENENDTSKLIEVSSRTSAYVFTPGTDLFTNKNKKDIEALLYTDKCRGVELNKMGIAVRLKAPVAVTFKMSELPAGFPGNLHKFKDKQYMCKVMSNDYIGFERTLDSIEQGVYYICAVLCEDFQGRLDYDYFINNLRYDKLTAYYLEEEKGKSLHSGTRTNTMIIERIL